MKTPDNRPDYLLLRETFIKRYTDRHTRNVGLLSKPTIRMISPVISPRMIASLGIVILLSKLVPYKFIKVGSLKIIKFGSLYIHLDLRGLVRR